MTEAEGRKVRSMDPSELEALLTLCVLPGIGPVAQRRLLQSYGSATAALEAGTAEIGGPARRERGSIRVQGRVARAVESIDKLGIRVLRDTDAQYPQRLHHLADPPAVLFARGRLELADSPSPVVAVVGTRRHTRYGGEAARQLAGDLAHAGAVIASGLARGIDSIAHQAATPQRTIAVLGCGLDVVYPRQNERLQDEIGRQGLLLSEFVPGEPAMRHHFPRRNRLIAALAYGVVVVEGSKKSGSLITADHGLDLGREVFAVPGPIGRESTDGTHELLRDGAGLATDAAAILDAIGFPVKRLAEPAPRESRALPPNLSREARSLLRVLDADGGHVDALSAAAGITAPAALAALLELEVIGCARQLPGMHFCAA